MRDHVIYESRLELSRLIFADFDRAVHRILAQPFLLKARVARKIRKHIPDYFLVTDHGPVVVDVKPEHLLTRPTVAATFAWTRQLVEARAGDTRSGAGHRHLKGERAVPRRLSAPFAIRRGSWRGRERSHVRRSGP
jgi:hypothetical protein